MRRTSPDGGVANTTAVVRIMNERAVYEQTRQLGPVSASQLVAATGLSKPTIGLALGGLERAGLVRHERVKARTAATLIRQVGELAQSVPARIGLTFDDITHTVLGIPGVYEPESGRISAAPNLPGLDRPGSVEALRGKLGERFSIDNDVNLATVAEQAYGLGTSVRNFVFVSVGTGIGMGVVIDGRLYRGSHGRAGEISFLPVGDEGPEGAQVRGSADTRQHGILETVASAQGIVAIARGCGMSVDSVEQVFDAARAGDDAALRAVGTEADHLARALAAIIAVLDPCRRSAGRASCSAAWRPVWMPPGTSCWPRSRPEVRFRDSHVNVNLRTAA